MRNNEKKISSRNSDRFNQGRSTLVSAVSSFTGLLLGALIFSLSSCAPVGVDLGQTAAVTVFVPAAASLSRNALGTYADIAAVKLSIANGAATLVAWTALTKTGSGYTGNFDNLPLHQALDFRAQAFNASALKIFEGAVNQSLSYGDNQVLITLTSIDDGWTFPVLNKIVVSGAIVAETTLPFEFQVSGQASETLTWSLDALIRYDGTHGSFDTTSGTVALGGDGKGSFTVNFTAPAIVGNQTIRLHLVV